VDVAEILLKNNANIEAQNKYQRTPLHVACQNGHVNVVEMLLKNNANIEAQEEDHQWAPLHISCQNGHVNVVEILLKNNANIEAQDEDQWTPLHISCQKGHVNVVEIMLKNNANIEVKDKKGHTPISIACMNGHLKVVELLISRDAKINTPSKDGFTPLQQLFLIEHLLIPSSSENYTKMIKMLLGKDISNQRNDIFDTISQLQRKECTFTFTQERYMPQLFFGCSCGLTEFEGVCLVCAISCHQQHKMVSVKYIKCYCDCPQSGKCHRNTNPEVQKEDRCDYYEK